MRIEIKNRYTEAVIFSGEYENVRAAVEAAVAAKVSLSQANLSQAYLSSAYLGGANLSSAYLGGANLRGADLSQANLSRADLTGANLSRAILDGAYLRGANLSRADLTGANLSGANLRGADLSSAYLGGANLRGADLTGANLSRAILDGAYLSQAYLIEANLSGADLIGADLTGANLSASRLNEAVFTDAALTGTVLDPEFDIPYPSDAKLRNAGFELEGEWVIGYRTYKSQVVTVTVYEQQPEPYTATVFSVCQSTDCHPGLYMSGANWLANSSYKDSLMVRVRCKRNEIMRAGDKFRCKRLWVISAPFPLSDLVNANPPTPDQTT